MLATHILNRVAYLMDDTELHVSPGEYALDGIRKARKTIYAGNKDILYTAVLQVGQHIKPEVSALAMSHIHTRQVLVPVLTDAYYVVDNTANVAPLSHMDFIVNGIYPDYRIKRERQALISSQILSVMLLMVSFDILVP